MNDVAVLIASCDKYSDLWRPFFTFFFRYWPDCPYEVYLGSNDQVYEDSRVIPIRTGSESDWSSNFSDMLAKVPARRVLVLLEDYLLDRPVDTARILSLAKYMEKRQAACLRLFPCPGPDTPSSDNPAVGEIARGAEYRVSLQAALWEKSALTKLLRLGENPWAFEVHGSRRSDDLQEPFISVTDSGEGPPVSYYCTAIVKGKWQPEAVRLCESAGIAVDLETRPIESDRLLGRLREKAQDVVRGVGRTAVRSVLARANHRATRRTQVPLIERLSVAPDRDIREGQHAGKGCYYRTGLMNTLIKLRPKVCLEIGTHYGGTTSVFERYFSSYRPDGVLVTADIAKYTDVSSRWVRQVLVYPHSLDVTAHHNIFGQALLPDAMERTADSVEANVAILSAQLELISASAFDFCFIDGDHTEVSFLRDMEIARRLSASPHYLLLDDVKEGLHECAAVYEQEIVNHHHSYDFSDWPIFVGAALIWDKDGDR